MMPDGPETLERTFGELFAYLKEAEYAWEPVRPDRLLKHRCAADSFSPLVRYFGLGLEVAPAELEGEGLPGELIGRLPSLRPAVSRCGDLFIPHSHWGLWRHDASSYIYLGQESFELVRLLQPYLDSFAQKDVLDLGSGAGMLALELARHARHVLGIERCSPAVKWAASAARAQGIGNVSFHAAWIGAPEAESLACSRPAWDIAVFNPPLAVTQDDDLPHRDGGRYGVEVPLLFLEFAGRHLRAGGEVFCLSTNPIVNGRSMLFERINPRLWETLGKRCLDDRFNQSLHRKGRYSERGIQRIELWFLHLRKR